MKNTKFAIAEKEFEDFALQ